MIVRKILIIDDDPISNHLVERTLKECFQHIEVTQITDGLVGIHYIEDLIHEKKDLPDFVFLDLLMPTIDGFDFLEQLRNVKIDLPVFILTANLKNNIVIKLDNYKIIDIIEKPLTTEKITNALNKLLLTITK
jgi:DNA-binding response OmpR family regulator